MSKISSDTAYSQFYHLSQLYGRKGNDSLFGSEENDVLSGGAGNDYLAGEAGNDLLYGGNGNDLLYGGNGNDLLKGGSGNDSYFIDALGIDTIVDSSGTDTVLSAISWTLAPALEYLTLTGSDAINGTGNNLNNILFGNDNNNKLRGQSGNDILDGWAGQDTLVGGPGDDIYWVDSHSDKVIEKPGKGEDWVEARVTFVLSNNVESLKLLGEIAIDGTGNDLNNILLGNKGSNILSGQGGRDILIGKNGNDVLVGGSGEDILNGGKGKNSFIFNSENEGIDQIEDFASGSDRLQVKASKFGGGLTAGILDNNQFVLGTKALDADDRFIYNQHQGTLSFDIDGSGSADRIQIATLVNEASLHANDILVF